MRISFTLLLLSIFSAQVFAQNHLKISAGTDASLGLAAGLEYQMDVPFENLTLRMGPAVYYSSWTETTETTNEYTESSTTTIFGISANAYIPTQNTKLTFIAGGGAAFMSNSWKEASPTDSSIGPLVDGEYTDEEDATGAGVFFNVGLNNKLSELMAFEVNVPVFLIPYAYGTLFAPAITASIVWDF